MDRNKRIGQIIIVVGVILLLVWLWFTVGGGPKQKEDVLQEELPEVPFGNSTDGDQNDIDTEVDGAGFEVRIDGEDKDPSAPQPTLWRVSHVPTTDYKIEDREKETLTAKQSQIEIIDEMTGETIFETIESDSIQKVNIPVITYNDYESGYLFERELFFRQWDVVQTTDTIIQFAQELFFGSKNTIIYRYAASTGRSELTYKGAQKEKSIFKNGTCSQTLDTNLSQGDRGRDVESLQKLLETLFAYKPDAPGLFDGELALFIVDLQSKNKLLQTGALTDETRQWLLGRCVAFEQEQLETGQNSTSRFFIEGSFDGRGIVETVVSPDKTKQFSLMSSQQTTKGMVESFDGAVQQNIYSLPFNEWNLQWPHKDTIYLNTKPSGEVVGHVYGLNTKTKLLQKLYSGLGLSTNISPSGKKAIVGITSAKGYEIQIANLQTGSSLAVPFGDTFPEKCVWAPDELVIYCAVPDSLISGIYPDDYYMQIVEPKDTLWYYNIATGASGIIDQISAVRSQSPNGPDIKNLQLFQSSLPGQPWFLFFKNQSTGFVWAKMLPSTIAPTAAFTAEKVGEEIKENI